MVFLKLLLTGCLIVAAMAFPSKENGRNESHSAATYRLPDYIVPLHYNIKLIPHIKKHSHISHDMFEGESSTRIYICRKTRSISLHKQYLFTYNIWTTLINDGNGKIHKPTKHTYNSKTHIFVLHFIEKLSPGLYTLNMKFLGIKTDNVEGFFVTSYTTKERDIMWLNGTHFQAIGARRVFPCWDEPAFKTTFNISILHQKNYTALSNMPVRDTEYTDNGMVWTHFRTTPVMSTYLIAVAVTNFPFCRINTNILDRQTMWCRIHLGHYIKFAQSVFKLVTPHLKADWKSLMEIPKVDHVVISEFQNMSQWHFRDGTSKWGLIFYRETRIIYNEELEPVARKIEVARLVAREMAHHWFGNLVSPFWWSYLWINDGIAMLLAEDAINKTLPDSRMLDLFVVQIQREALCLDTHSFSLMKPLTQEINSTSDINSLFISVPCIKAPAVLRMLQHVLTDVIFRKGIDKYLNAHQLSSATPDDLWTAIQIILTESNHKYKLLNLKEVMDTWITQSHYPIINVIRNYQNGDIVISQENCNGKSKWWIPVTYTTQTELNFNNTLPSHWLKPQTQSINLTGIGLFDWFILNLQQTGYYRVNYDPTTWRRIARYLNSNDYANIHVLNRAQIIDDAFYLAMENKSNFSIFWELANYLSRETDYIAWYPMIKAFEYLSTLIPFSEIENFKEKMYKLLPVILKKMGYQEDPSENDLIKCLRQEITKWACALGDSYCRSNAINKLEWHLDNPEKHKILPWWKDWTFCKGLIEADSTVWMKVMEMYKKERNNKILEYLTCSKDPYIIRIYLELISSDDNIIKIEVNDSINIFLLIITKHAKNNEMFEYILENFEKIKPRQVSTTAALIIILNYGYTEKRQNMILSKFVKNNMKEKEVMKTMKQILHNRKKRLEKIHEIVPNDVKEDVVTNKESKEEHFEKPQEMTKDIKNDIKQTTYMEQQITVIQTEITEVCRILKHVYILIIVITVVAVVGNCNTIIDIMKSLKHYIVLIIRKTIHWIVFLYSLYVNPILRITANRI